MFWADWGARRTDDERREAIAREENEAWYREWFVVDFRLPHGATLLEELLERERRMAFVDAAFRAKLSDADCADLVRALANVDVRIAPPEAAVVTHAFVKVRQESREGDALRPYVPSIAYREMVYQRGSWRWAFGIHPGDDGLSARLVLLAPFVTYIGKRGSFVQFRRLVRVASLGPEFTQPVQNQAAWMSPPRGVHIVTLDDFGPEADMETLSSFTARTPTRDRHRRFIETIVPVGLVNTGPGFSEYRQGGAPRP